MSKAKVTIREFDGTLIEEHEFDTNQEMADVAMRYWGKPVDVVLSPIGRDDDFVRDYALDMLL